MKNIADFMHYLAKKRNYYYEQYSFSQCHTEYVVITYSSGTVRITVYHSYDNYHISYTQSDKVIRYMGWHDYNQEYHSVASIPNNIATIIERVILEQYVGG